MGETGRNVLQDALDPEEERIDLIAALLASLPPPGPSQSRTDIEWIKEIERRARGDGGDAGHVVKAGSVRRRLPRQMKPLSLAAEAIDELSEAAGWYESKRAGLAAEFLGEIERILPLIQGRPRSFPRLQRAASCRPPCQGGSEPAPPISKWRKSGRAAGNGSHEGKP